jgi:AmmeMemoRadiSam system protein A
MAPSSSPDADATGLTEPDRRRLLELADEAIRSGLAGRRPTPADIETVPDALRERRGVFVTVTVAGELNGCIGSVWPAEPLYVAVPRLAREAAFADPRLPRLQAGDYRRTAVHISILSAPEPLTVGSDAELLAVLRPGVDGLIITDGTRRATFLPAVWEKLPDSADFLAHLKAKAGMPTSGWPARLSVHRYTASEFGSDPV